MYFSRLKSFLFEINYHYRKDQNEFRQDRCYHQLTQSR